MWTCPNCDSNNDSDKEECFVCGTPKPVEIDKRSFKRKEGINCGEVDNGLVYKEKKNDVDIFEKIPVFTEDIDDKKAAKIIDKRILKKVSIIAISFVVIVILLFIFYSYRRGVISQELERANIKYKNKKWFHESEKVSGPGNYKDDEVFIGTISDADETNFEINGQGEVSLELLTNAENGLYITIIDTSEKVQIDKLVENGEKISFDLNGNGNYTLTVSRQNTNCDYIIDICYYVNTLY